MRFKTIVIKKRHIILLGAAILALCFGIGLALSMRTRKAVSVFSHQEVYDSILDDGLPEGKDRNFLKEIVDSLVGFDTDDPTSIIEDNLPITAKNDTEEETKNEENKEEEAEQTPTPKIADNTRYPSREQINSFSSVEVSNATDYQINSGEMISAPLGFEVKKDNSPQILIMHTHTTESYGNHGDRNIENAKNVVSVGAEIKRVLESEGIGVIHDITFHDFPSYQGAYTRAMGTITKNLNEYPEIKIVLDIHRDGYVYADGTKLHRTTQINGEKTAQVMIVSGTDSMGLENPAWRENLKLGTKIQSAASIMYPTLMRPINLRKERFNLHLTTGSLLIEVGANGNTLEEAIRGGHYFAKALAAVLK